MQIGNKYGIFLTLKTFLEHSNAKNILVLMYTYPNSTELEELLSKSYKKNNYFQ